MLRLLGNCSFKGNYEYTEEQINKIFDKLYSELDKVHQRFIGAEFGNGKFSLSNDNICKENPSLIMPLPDGTYLRAVAAEDDTMPNLSIYLQTGNGEEKSVCYAEYNYEREAGKELCIGIWNSQEEDPYLYLPYNK